MFDFGDTLALLIGLVASIIIILACLGAYVRTKVFLTPHHDIYAIAKSAENTKWDSTYMANAIAAVREKRMGYLKASQHFKVPRSTLFDKNFESMPVDYALNMESKFYGLSQSDLRKMAYELAAKNNIPNPFTNQAAGRYWLKGFLQRKKTLTVRKPTGTSYARAHGFTNA
ncbi:unnamed protein product [Acanthoscelides obtectus]|uniref:HTH psq-type domain-containing protein n=1 Tax=Acanthoscelides obtectus TaxID=200917 RepID=A0A9P0PT32_ACAOB|nr:unnamed protein product [Acanthoscelides obtectus]CAK1653270.1 hypothetical protein AOBTE_LOCUS18175 [Acanthoscelides obtectus]